MKKLLAIGTGIVTGIGGFLEAGSIATALQAGAAFGYQLAWAVLLGTLGLVFLTEMSGRLAAVSQRPLAGAIRERFGFGYFVVPLVVGMVLAFLTVAAEIGGVGIALQMATGISFRWWALPVAFLGWLLLWKGSFGVVQDATAFLGLVSVVFVVGALALHPEWARLGASLLPSRPTHDEAHYWFLAVSILGASISSYLYYFYSAGAIEQHWDPSYLRTNRFVAGFGNGLGGVLAVSVLVVAALVFEPRGITISRYEQAGLALVPPLGLWGFALLVATVGVNCFGATVTIALSAGYLLAQGFGWDWGENTAPVETPRFSLAFSVVLVLAALVILAGVDPLKLTNLTMALAAASLPVAIVPLVVLMNDRDLMGEHRNGWISNTALALLVLLSIVLLLAAVPLQVLGGGG